MSVHGESLSSVQKFHEKHHVISVACNVILAEPGQRLAGDGITEQAAVVESSHSDWGTSSHAGGRTDPIFRGVGLRVFIASEVSDAFSTLVEPRRWLVCGEHDGLHEGSFQTLGLKMAVTVESS